MKPAGQPGTWRVVSAGLRRWRASTPAEAGNTLAHRQENQMDDGLKRRFRRFAERLADDEAIDEGGLTGRDVKSISAAIADLVAVRYATLQELADEALAKCGPL